MRALVCLLAVFGAACTEEVAVVGDTPCVLDSECAPSELCLDGLCRANPDPDRCTQNADCDTSLVCRDNACEPAATSGECSSDADCDTADRCTTAPSGGAAGDCLLSRECANAEPGAPCDTGCYGNCVGRESCDDDGDCAITEQCDAALLVCLPIGDCSADGECPDDAACVEGVCHDNGACVVDVDCPDSQSCVDGACTRNDVCADDADCPADQRCAEGVCLRRSDCALDDDCAFDERCIDGTCNVIGACDDVDDCPADPGIACLDGVCSRAPCGRDSECDDGLFCTGAETCNPRVGCAAGPAPTSTDLPACATESCDEDTDSLIRAPRNELCGDGSPCTDDVCDVDVGCVNPANSFVPAPGPLGDCRQTVCSAGALTSVENDVEVPTDQGLPTDCRRAICQGGARTLVVDDVETPVQGPQNDCRRQICQNGDAVAVNDDTELPPQGLASDCVREICSGGVATSTPDNAEVPLQGPTNDCTRQSCSAGVVVNVANDTEIPLQGPPNDCTRQTCSGGTVLSVANNAEVPPQRSSTDCTTQTCSNSQVVDVPAAETPVQRSPTDCTTQTCSNGNIVDVAANETLAQLSPTDCTSQVCSNGAPTNAPNNAEIPAQVSSTDCKRQVCSAGGVVVQNNDSEDPNVTVGCKDGVCSGGASTLVENDDNCGDGVFCTAGSCNVDGTCSQIPDDSLCDCAGSAVGICSPDDPRAATSGSLEGCVCLTPTEYVCGVDDQDLDKQVLEPFALFTRPPTGAGGAAAIVPGTTFVWDLAQVPTGADPAAQSLINPTSRLATFQATTPSALGVRDYRLRVTIQEPDLPSFTCQFNVGATKIPDTLEVTLFMNDPLDVDLHLIGGADASIFDFPFHLLHEPADPFFDNPIHDCHYANCPVCTVNIPGQTCTPPSPRVVDFDDPVDGVALADKQDPQLDIDNQRGCFTAENGDLQCIPEKVTVELPDAGQYFIFPYLWGNALAVLPGQASTPATTTVTIQITCRDVTRSYLIPLSSIATDGTIAVEDDPVRYGDVATAAPQVDAPLVITIPATGACTLPAGFVP